MTTTNIEIKSSFPRSKKIYVEGSRPDILVPMREITLDDTLDTKGDVIEKNEPFRVYEDRKSVV